MTAADIFRSETMLRCEMKLKRDYAFQSLQNILDHNGVHFIDQNPDVQPFQRPYAANVVKVAELEGLLHNLRLQIECSDIKIAM